MPTNLAICADHAPAAFTTLRVETGPRVVSTLKAFWPFLLIPVTSVFFYSVAPCSAAEAMKPFITL